MADTQSTQREAPVPGTEPEGDVYDLGDLRLPPPLMAALLPWWITLGPAAIAMLTGRFLLAALLSGGGLLISAAAAAAILIAGARAEE